MQTGFYIMDIHTAAKYMSLGYRITRLWSVVSYMYNFHGHIRAVDYDGNDFSLSFSMHDLLANDWEIITEGIIKEFPIIYQE